MLHAKARGRQEQHNGRPRSVASRGGSRDLSREGLDSKDSVVLAHLLVLQVQSFVGASVKGQLPEALAKQLAHKPQAQEPFRPAAFLSRIRAQLSKTHQKLRMRTQNLTQSHSVQLYVNAASVASNRLGRTHSFRMGCPPSGTW